MGLSRRFLNLILDKRIHGACSLSCMDLTRLELFNTIPPLPLNRNTSESEGPQENTLSAGDNPKNTMRMIQLPTPSMNFRASATNLRWYMECLPLAGGNLLCADQSGRLTLFNTDTCRVSTMPALHRIKSSPLSIFVPRADDDSDGGGIIYIMESHPMRQMGDGVQLSPQFEACTLSSFTKFCEHQLLPRPPFVNPKYCVRESTSPTISACAVVGGGSPQVCLSVDGAGTYCLDTVTHTWTQIGDWTLPFVGKVEYVPELKLWLGFCAKDMQLGGFCAQDMQLGAADLSTMMDMDSQPQLVDTWKEFEAPQGWIEVMNPQLVNLGSGKFCIARWFCARTVMPSFDTDFDTDDDVHEEYFTVLTGADVVSSVHDRNGTDNTICNSNTSDSNGRVQLKMIKHNSRCHMSYAIDGTIRSVF